MHGRSGQAVSPPGPDPYPDLFAFSPQINVARSSGPFPSNALTPTGFDTAATVTVTSGFEASINSGAFSATPGTLTPGQTLRMRLLTSGASYNITTTGQAFFNTHAVGSFSVTTLQDPTVFQFGVPSSNWNGNADKGFEAAPYSGTPPPVSARRRSKANGGKPRPVGHFIIPQDLVIFPGGDLILPVFARCSGAGLAGVRFHPEGGTPIMVTVSRRLALPKADGTTKIRDVYAIKLSTSDWTHLTGSGGNIYAELVPNDLTNYEVRTIGPFRIYPRAVENDWLAYISSDGKDDAGSVLSDPGLSGVTFAGVFTTVRNAVLNFQATNGTGITAPKFVIMKSGTANVENTAFTGVSTPGWITFTIGPNVTVIGSKGVPPDFSDPTTWDWKVGLTHIRFKGRNSISDPGLTWDHLNFSGFQTEYGGGGHLGWGGSQLWMDGCVNTVSATPIADARGNASPLYNMRWNRGCHPGMHATSTVVSSAGMHHTDDLVEYMDATFGNGASYLTGATDFTTPETPTVVIDGIRLRTIPGPMFQGQQLMLDVRAKDIDTRFFEPDLHDAAHFTYTGAKTIIFQKNHTKNGSDGTSGGLDTLWITIDGLDHPFALSKYPATSFAAIKAFVDGLGEAGLSFVHQNGSEFDTFLGGIYIAALDVAPGRTAQFIPPTQLTSTPLVIYAFPDQHTEFNQADPLDAIPEHSTQNQCVFGVLIDGRSMFGTTPFRFAQVMDAWRANVLVATMIPPPGATGYDRSGDYSYSNGENCIDIYNYEENGKGIANKLSTAESIIGYQAVYSLGVGHQEPFSDGVIVPGEQYIHTIMAIDNTTSEANDGVGLQQKSVTNVAIGDTAWSNLFNDRAGRDYRQKTGGAYDTNKTAPIESVDLFYNERPNPENVSPVSSAQSVSTVGLLDL